MSDTSAPRSWKLGCKDRKGDPWAYNALRFATKEECQVYGRDLSWRWLALVEWEPHPSDDPVNRKLTKQADGRWLQEDVPVAEDNASGDNGPDNVPQKNA